jgi:hypothetical protein
MTCPVGKVEDTKGVIRCPKIKERQTIQCPPKKRTNNDLQSTTQKTKDQATRTPLKTRDKHRCPGIGEKYSLFFQCKYMSIRGISCVQ